MNNNGSKQKRILVFSVAYQPFVGGAEVAVQEITKRLIPLGFSFDLLTVNLNGLEKSEEVLSGVRIFRLSCGTLGKFLFPLTALLAALKLHRQNRYDASWAIMANYAGLAGLFFKLSRPTVPFVLTLQEGDSLSEITRKVFLFYPLFKMIFRKADKITAISNYLAEWARAMGARCPIEVVPNGVDIEAFSVKRGAFSRDQLRKKLGFSQTDVVLVTTSRLVKKNAVGDIVESLRFLPSDFKLLVIGSGEQEAFLQQTASRLKLSDRVRFIGFIAHADLPPYLWASDIFVRPSRSEGMGNSFIEAFAAGLPVIATRAGGIPDFLKDGETGVFCEVGNPESIARKATFLASNSVLRGTIIGNARRLTESKYDWNTVAARMGDVLTEK